MHIFIPTCSHNNLHESSHLFGSVIWDYQLEIQDFYLTKIRTFFVVFSIKSTTIKYFKKMECNLIRKPNNYILRIQFLNF